MEDSISLSDWIAIAALVVAGGALSLEVRRWFESGPKIHLSIMGDAVLLPGDDGVRRLSLTATNRGSVPTRATHFLIFMFDSWWHRLRNRPSWTAVGTDPTFPADIAVNGACSGLARYTDETLNARREGRLYVGVQCSHRGRPYFIKVPPERPDFTPDDTVSS